MKVLVTGAAGYIGSVTTELLIHTGHQVVSLDNFERGHREAIHEEATFVQDDLCDREAVRDVFRSVRPEAVLHFAAYAAAYALVEESMERPEAYFSNNVGGSCNLLEAMCATACRRIVFSSSCTVYGLPEQEPVTEEMPRRALNPCGASKILVGDMLQWYV